MNKDYVEKTIGVAGGTIQMMQGGNGGPLLVLHNDMGGAGWIPLYENLAQEFNVYVPSLPGYGKSDRPGWVRSVRDIAIIQNYMLKTLGIDSVNVIGFGIGAWVAAEMATMCQRQFERMVLVSPMGIQPEQGEIVDQFLVSSEEYVKLGFHDQTKMVELFGAEQSEEQIETWELNREMTVRIAWKPYMFNQVLPYLLPEVGTPTTVVRGGEDKVTPLSCSERYVETLPNGRLEVIADCGHYVDIERPNELASLVKTFML